MKEDKSILDFCDTGVSIYKVIVPIIVCTYISFLMDSNYTR